MAGKKKITIGKQKIEIKRLESEDVRYVCFSKRKMGIFTKASELATLCGAEVAVVLDSPKGCPYTFGTPGVSQIIDRFLSGGLTSLGLGSDEACHSSVVKDLNSRCKEISKCLDDAKKKRATLKKRLNMLKQAIQQVRMFENMEELSLIELLEMKKSLHELKEKVEFQLFQLFNGGASSSNCANPVMMLNPFGPGTSQDGLTVSNFTMTNLSQLRANQTTPNGSKVDHEVVMKRNEIDLNQPAEPSDDMESGNGFY